MCSLKVKRHRAGKPPEWAHNSHEEESHIHLTPSRAQHSFPSLNVTVSPKHDSRLCRISENLNREQVISDHRRIHQAQVVTSNEEEEDEKELDERRRKIREKLLRNCGEEEEMDFLLSDEDDEMDFEEKEERIGIQIVGCVFVPKAERSTILARERMEEEKRVLEEKERTKLELRKLETKGILVEEINKEKNLELEEENIDMNDEVDVNDEVNEYDAWKVREIARVKRSREAGKVVGKEQEKVRSMNVEAKPFKKKLRFMQKYYHKGAFYQENGDDMAGVDEIYMRDFSAPTGEDKMDKSLLPKVMQVKNFGRSGRTKWTHLVNEDTTHSNNPWTYNDLLRAKYDAKMVGMNANIAKPKGSMKLKDWEN